MSNSNAQEINKLAEIIAKLLPGPDVQGDPFWTVMEIDANNMATGSYQSVNNDKIVPLFYSQVLAEQFCSKTHNNKDIAVRGISKPHLAAMIQMWKLGLLKLAIAEPKSNNSDFALFLPNNPEEFEDFVRERYSQ